MRRSQLYHTHTHTNTLCATLITANTARPKCPFAISQADWQLSLNWPKINGDPRRALWSFGQLASRATAALAAAIKHYRKCDKVTAV